MNELTGHLGCRTRSFIGAARTRGSRRSSTGWARTSDRRACETGSWRSNPATAIKPAIAAGGSKLDKKKIASIQADTVALQAILGEVFDETGSNGEPAVEPARTSSDGPVEANATAHETLFPGLDQRHALLLYEVCNRDIIDQATFAALAQKHGLFPAGAMETINEWAFERFEEPVLDEGEPIEIAHHLIRSSHNAMTSEQPL